MKIKNWSKFQHFKDRRPPWVKLYRDILDDMEWHELDPLASKVLVMCWLIASEDDGNIPSPKILAFRLRMTEKQTIDCLNKLSHWLEQPDNDVISTRYQHDLPETERETEKETETEKKKNVADALVLPDWMPTETWEAFLTMRKRIKKPLTEYAIKLLVDKLTRFKANGQDIQAVLEKSITNNWQDVFEIHEKQQASNKFDVARATTPTPDHAFDALRKIEADRKKAAPMPESVKQFVQKVKVQA